MHLRELLLALFVICISSAASAMSLGDGRILSHLGEAFSADIALSGSYNKDVSFSQVRNAECRTSVIEKTANGCDSLYEGPLTFSVRRRSDGQYFLKVAGRKSDEFFYRILIRTSSATDGTVYKVYEFLPEFGANPEVQPVAENDVEVVPANGKYGVVGGKVIEVVQDEEGIPSAKKAAVQVTPRPVKSEAADEVRQKHRATAVKMPVKKPLETHLQIKKYGEYADDIHALRKENGEIEEQIVLLEKHIGLLKEVIRLKSQAGASSVVETVVAASAPVSAPVPAPVRAPLSVQSQVPQTNDEPGLLIWILLVAVLVLSAALGAMYIKIKRLNLKPADQSLSGPQSASFNEIKSLDLTGAFIKPKW